MVLAGPRHAAPMGLKTVLFGRWYHKLRIPAKADTCSNSKRTLIPIDIGQLSERSDALGLVINKCPI